MNKNLIIVVTLVSLTLTFVSCERSTVGREYKEIVLEPGAMTPDKPRESAATPPSMGLTKSSGLGLPPGHPDISGLPPGHPDISGMDMGNMGQMAMPSDPQMQKALAASVAKPPLSWEVPEGWSEQVGSGMRMVTFNAQNDGGPIECTIVSLAGGAGGLESNVVRWMQQINVSPASDQALKEFLGRQETIGAKGGFSLNLIDLTEFSQPGAPSMLSAIGELPDLRIFVKMTGKREAVIGEKESFKKLCRSLMLQN